MANDKIKKSDIIGKISLKAEIKALEELLEVTGKLKDETKELAKQNLGEVIGIDVATIKGIKDLDKAKTQLAKTTEQSTKLAKQEKKIRKALKDLTDEEVKAKLEQTKIDKKRKDLLAQEVILQSKTAGTIEKLNAENKKLRILQRGLNLETEEGQRLNKEYNATIEKNTETIRENSDAYVKQKMNIGNYTESIEEATAGLHPMIGSIVQSGKMLVKQGKSALESAKNLDKSALSAKNLGKAMKNLGKIGILAIITALGAVIASFANTRGAIEAFEGSTQKAMATVKALFEKTSLSVQIGLEKIALAYNELKNFLGAGSKEAIEASKASIASLEAQRDAVVDLSDSVGNANKAINDFFEAKWTKDDVFLRTSDQLAKLNGELEILEERAGDDTLDMREKLKFSEEYNKKLLEVTAIEKERADASLDVAVKAVKADLVAFENLTDEDIKAKKFMGNPEMMKAIGVENLNALGDALAESQEIENVANTRREKMARETRMTLQDIFEQELDYAIDAFDKQKTINERKLADEALTLDERTTILRRTDELAEKSFANQIKLVEEHTKQKLDFSKLVALDDEEEIRRELSKITTSEIVKKRILEIINERKLATQDMHDAEDMLQAKRIAKDLRIAKSQQNINKINVEAHIESLDYLLQKEEEKEKFSLAKFIEIADLKLDAQKDALDEELANKIKNIEDTVVEEDEKNQLIEEAEAVHLKAIEDLNRDHIDEIDEAKEKQKEKDDKRRKEELKANKDFLLESAELIKDHLLSVNALKAENLREDLDASKQQEDRLQALADQRVLGAEESLSAEKEAQAQIQKELARTEKRKQIIEASMTALKLVASYAEKGINNPTSKAGKDIATLMTAVKGIQFFAEGTESVEGGVKGVDSVPAMLMPQERVFTVEQNKRIGNISNDDASRILEAHRKGAFEGTVLPTSASVQVKDNSNLIKKLDDVITSVKNIPVASVDHHALADYITNTIRTQNTIERRHYKGNQIFK
jgi:hypothetical protein